MEEKTMNLSVLMTSFRRKEHTNKGSQTWRNTYKNILNLTLRNILCPSTTIGPSFKELESQYAHNQPHPYESKEKIQDPHQKAFKIKSKDSSNASKSYNHNHKIQQQI